MAAMFSLATAAAISASTVATGECFDAKQFYSAAIFLTADA
jgi:hypothetical protein